MTTPSAPLSLLLLVATGGCVINGNKYTRPSELEQSWLVSRTRILGIRAEPAEIAPGQRASFEALLVGPPGEEEQLVRLWLACPDGGTGCATAELEGLDLEDPDPEQLEELGFIGFQLGIPGEAAPEYTAPPDLLDGLDEAAKLEGLNVTVQLTAFPLEQLDSSTTDIDFNEVEAGFKRLVVSEASTPNNNPRLDGFAVDETRLPDEVETVLVEPGQQYDLALFLADPGGIETYEFLNSDGEVEERVEEPYVSWFTTGGVLVESLGLWPFLDASWEAPDEVGTEGTWFAVVRDRRGGMSWWRQDWVVTDEP